MEDVQEWLEHAMKVFLACANSTDTEKAHIDADEALVVLIRHMGQKLGYADYTEEVLEVYESLRLWYA